MSTSFSTASFRKTQKAGQNLAKDVLSRRLGRKAVILGLVGDLGGGKTTFLQGFAKGLGVKEKILSPTFVILKRFQLAGKSFVNFYHIDCYRIKDPKDLLVLDFKKIVSNSKNIVAVEWADRVKKILPKETIWIHFKFINAQTRQIVIR